MRRTTTIYTNINTNNAEQLPKAIVPSFCGTVDGRLLVAHLAPLLRQLCARMGDSKEAVRTHTTQARRPLLAVERRFGMIKLHEIGAEA